MITRLNIVDHLGESHPIESNRAKIGVTVNWMFNGELISKSVKDENRHALVAASILNLDRVVIIFGSLAGLSDSQGGAIFSADGDFMMSLDLPELVSDQYKEFEKKVGKSKAIETLKFNNTYTKDDSGSQRIVVSISFNYEWYELRFLDPLTGQFYESLGVGKM